MTAGEDEPDLVERLTKDLTSRINYYAAEYDFTYSQVIGVLMCISMDLHSACPRDPKGEKDE